ncbi:MAG: hypothetical protein RL021_486 [Bacteroidota bacterium]|jgi:Zn-dependent M28 family amino/carboxypeptidase
MRIRFHNYFLIAGFFIPVLFGCHSSDQKTEPPTDATVTEVTSPVAPFNADSAFSFVKKQVDFGPRKPNTAAHGQCADYLTGKLKSYTPDVVEQEGSVTAYDGTILKIRNIIASFNKDQAKRILLFAHWDTRPWADQDTTRTREPILGADDGGSGVGVLLELARQFALRQPSVGVDIALFDAEDWGKNGGGAEGLDSYGLGTQYWTRQPHVPGYTAEYGILLDMVGAVNAQFRMEGNSSQVAPGLNEKVWRTAARLGYSNYFLYEQGGYVTDDHVYVIRYGIPCIDIIGSDNVTATGFGRHWHTHADDLTVIDKKTLQAVGQTLMEIVYGESN